MDCSDLSLETLMVVPSVLMARDMITAEGAAPQGVMRYGQNVGEPRSTQ